MSRDYHHEIDGTSRHYIDPSKQCVDCPACYGTGYQFDSEPIDFIVFPRDEGFRWLEMTQKSRAGDEPTEAEAIAAARKALSESAADIRAAS